MKILLVTTRWPWPIRRGNQLRTAQMASWLAAEHQVTLLAPRNAEPAPSDLPYRVVSHGRSLAGAGVGVIRSVLTGLPLQSGVYDGRRLRVAVRSLAAASDLVILQTVRLAPVVDALGTAPMAVDLIDSIALNFVRRAEFDQRWRGPLLRAEAARLLRWERSLLERARLGWVVADRDAEYLAQDLAPAVAARLAVLPVGAASPPRAPGTPPEHPTLVLTGNLGYFPTADGAIEFLRHVWPRLAARRPELRLVLAGDRPGLGLRRAAARGGPRVRVMDSPPDLHTVLAGARIALAPARCGSGVPVKVLEAWAAGVPVVAHPYTAAGAGAEPGRELLAASDPAEWVTAIESLLDDAALARRLVAAGRQRLARFQPARLCAELLDAVRQLKIAPGA